MRAWITGITGFAGSHLAEYLLAEHPEVEVYGTYRWRSRMDNVEHLRGKIHLVESDLRDFSSVLAALEHTRPDYVFHLVGRRPAGRHEALRGEVEDIVGARMLERG